MEQNEQNFKAKTLVVTVEEITPERAADWLENHNRRNRPLSEHRAKMLAREMTEGRWRINTTAPISFTAEGELVDVRSWGNTASPVVRLRASLRHINRRRAPLFPDYEFDPETLGMRDPKRERRQRRRDRRGRLTAKVADKTMMHLDRVESRKFPPRSKQHDAIRYAVDGLDIALFRGDTTKMRSALSYCIELVGEPLMSFWAENYRDGEGLCGHGSVPELIRYKKH